jgi:alkanesulfonate monooxygenase SsuD/methylene tetrahydromethanopterin reductase-like flavin-dependent oxidoreductase (luciferase family)
MQMPEQDVTFGIVIQATPRGFSEEVMADPTKATQVLIDNDSRFIETVRPHFNTVWVEDHFQWGNTPVIEAMTTLSFLAGKHPGLRFGHIVMSQAYRNPALTAKMAANLQALTYGNFILGIGAGWKEDEYRAYGYDFPSGGQRVDELEEAVQVIRAMWTQSPANFEGKYYRIRGAECQPQPNPPIPLLIAGTGEKMLHVVAKYADWWNGAFKTPEQYAHLTEVLSRYCRDIGRDPGEILLSYYALLSLSNDPARLKHPAPGDQNHFVTGSPDEVAEEFSRFIQLGVRHFQVRFLDFPSTEGVDLFLNGVLPRLRR